MKRQVWLLLSLVLPLLLSSGCVTRAVWTNDYLEAWNEPAAVPNVRLYEVPARQDFLVVYTEHSERHEKIRPRAYFLNESTARLQAKSAPHFVNPKLAAGCPAVPVYLQPFAGTNAPMAATYAMMETNGIAFVLYRPSATGKSPEEFTLPIYNDGLGKYERAALLPPAAVVDTAMIGGIFWWWALASANGEVATGQ